MEIRDGKSSAEGRRHFAEIILMYLTPIDVQHKHAEQRKLTLGHWAGIPFEPPGGKITVPAAIRDKAIMEFQSTLRDLTDQWIDSGKQEGIEQPWQRSVQFTSTDHQQSIGTVLFRFWQRNPLTVGVGGNNELFFFTTSTVWQSDWAQLSKEPVEVLMARARDRAIEQFALLMDSPSRYRIFRCEICRSYFAKIRMPKRGAAIKSGSYCEQCKGEAGKKRVEAAREHWHSQMIEWSVNAVAQWRPGNRDGKRIDWIMKKVNARLEAEGRDTIKSNWVNRHLKKIEAEVEWRKHAKNQSA